MTEPAGPAASLRFRVPPPGATRILVVLALINLVAYPARNRLFAVYPELRLKYGVDDAEIGFLQTVFMLPHAIATLPFGWAGDRYDRRRVIAVGLVIASLAGAGGALAERWESLALSRALVGFGTAAVVPVANSILGQLYDGPTKASRISIFNLGLFLGGVTGFVVGGLVRFPLVVVVLAIPGLVLAAVLSSLPVPTRASRSPSTSLSSYIATFTRRFVVEGRELLAIRTLRWVILSTTTMAFAAGGYNAWLLDFLKVEKGMSEGQAQTLLVMALFAGLAGILLGGRIADRLRARATTGRLWTIAIGMSLTIPCSAIAIVIPLGPGLYAAGVATMFFISWYHAPVAATVDDLAPAGRSVAAQGLVIFTMHLVGTAPSSWIVGLVSDAASLSTAMWVPTVALAVAALCMAAATRSFATDADSARRSRLGPPIV